MTTLLIVASNTVLFIKYIERCLKRNKGIMSGGNDLKAYLDRKRSESGVEEVEELWMKLEDFHSKKYVVFVCR